MKKINNKGFILAETLVVSIFLTLIFTMIYSNFYPIIGEYEKRESYDDVDGKYAAYWIKRMIESDSYILKAGNYDSNISTKKRTDLMNNLGYMRFECDDISEVNNQREICKGLVKLLEISNCDSDGNGCDIYITRYQIGTSNTPYSPDFKDVIRESTMTRKDEFCYHKRSESNANKKKCYNEYFRKCCISEGLYVKDDEGEIQLTGYDFENANISNTYPNTSKTIENDQIAIKCRKYINDKVFNTSTKDYILSLPNYSNAHHSTNAGFRVIIVFHHTKDDNDFYSFSNMEVNK